MLNHSSLTSGAHHDQKSEPTDPNVIASSSTSRRYSLPSLKSASKNFSFPSLNIRKRNSLCRDDLGLMTSTLPSSYFSSSTLTHGSHHRTVPNTQNIEVKLQQLKRIIGSTHPGHCRLLPAHQHLYQIFGNRRIDRLSSKIDCDEVYPNIFIGNEWVSTVIMTSCHCLFCPSALQIIIITSDTIRTRLPHKRRQQQTCLLLPSLQKEISRDVEHFIPKCHQGVCWSWYSPYIFMITSVLRTCIKEDKRRGWSFFFRTADAEEDDSIREDSISQPLFFNFEGYEEGDFTVKK